LVSPVTLRHPSELAKVAATIDHIWGGRVERGFGAGWFEEEHRAYGFPFPGAGDRFDVLEEQLEILTRSWADGPCSFEGRHYRLEDCPALPKPLQRPRPPLIMGGAAGPRALDLAVRYADEYNAFAPLDECRARRERLLEACERGGRQVSFSVAMACVIGAERLERVLALAGESKPGDEWLVGTVDEVREQLREIEAIGTDRVYLQHLAADPEMVELLAGLR